MHIVGEKLTLRPLLIGLGRFEMLPIPKLISMTGPSTSSANVLVPFP